MSRVAIFSLLVLCGSIVIHSSGSISAGNFENLQSESTNRSPVWYSQLFPLKKNKYQYQNVKNFQLPDFSYAGYHGGEKNIPIIPVTKVISPLSGDNDNTKHIQKALYDAKGGALLLLPGTYPVSSEIIVPDHTVLRGSGIGKTFIIMINEYTRKHPIITGNRSDFTAPKIVRWEQQKNGKKFKIIGGTAVNTKEFYLLSTKGLSKGDLVLIKNEVTDNFRRYYNDKQKNENKIWPSDRSALKFLRKIIMIQNNKITIDTPLTLPLRIIDHPHLIKVDYMAQEIGVENFSIGFRRPENFGLKEDNLSLIHAAKSISFGNIMNGWIKNIKTFSPDNSMFHIRSAGINLNYSRFVTVLDCDFGFPAHTGDGGNGYIYILSTTNDCLLKNCIARSGRHNFLFHWGSSGNVLSNCTSIDSKLPNDFHHSLANSNLIENMKIFSDNQQYAFAVKDRGAASYGAGMTGTNNVFWKIKIISNSTNEKTKQILSQQAASSNGKGYVIGVTDVAGSRITTASEWREGVGKEDGLKPDSLYTAQKKLRLSHKNIVRKIN